LDLIEQNKLNEKFYGGVITNEKRYNLILRRKRRGDKNNTLKKNGA
jgi:hypothetical protein